MNLDILNCDKWVIDNSIPEIKTSNIYSTKSLEPDPDGLGSYEIFGRPGTEERKRTFAYIDLVNKFVHPHCYYELTRLQRNIKDLIAGNSDFYVDDFGKLKEIKQGETPPSGKLVGTGVNFLYKVWDKLNFKVTPDTAPGTAMRYEFFNNLNKNEIFMSKCPVIPPFYRDIDVNNKKKNEINTFYTKLLINAASLRATSGMFEMFGVSSSDKKIQETLLDLYNYFIDIVGGSKGFIHRNVMGKTTDYSARAVISMARYDANSVDDVEVSFDRSAIPLSTICKCFAPFIKFGIKKIVDRVLSGNDFIYLTNKKGEIIRKKLASDYMSAFSSDKLDELIELYDESFEHRSDIFKLRCEDGSEIPLMYIDDSEETDSTTLLDNNSLKTKHPINLTELFYMAAYDTVRDKHVFITRYPIEDHNNIYPSKINIIPTINTTKKIVLGEEYPKFPIIPKNVDNTHIYVSTLRPCPQFLKALGGDFDGDQTSIQGVYTEEANAEADKYIYSIANIVNVNNKSMREFAEVNQVGIFNLTYRYVS